MKIQLNDGTVIERCRGNKYYFTAESTNTTWLANNEKLCGELFKELYSLQNEIKSK